MGDVKEMPAANYDGPVEKYSKNFWPYEFDCKDGTPVPDELQGPLGAFVSGNLQPLRDFTGLPCKILSAYRHEAYNKKVGGVPNSRHIYDRFGPGGVFAVDIMVPGLDPPTVAFIIEGLINIGVMEEGGLGLYKNFVHYDNRGYKARW